MSPNKDPRQRRLRRDQELLERMNRESDHVRAVAVNPVGGAPERYIVTFLCKGIVGIDSAKNPILGERHEVEIYCDADYPADVPKLRWITPIWHPNIRHKEPKDVCVNKKEWLAGMYLDHLCWQMFEMVQYKNYHADPTDPFPLDHEVAEWVKTFAEPRGIVDRQRGKAIDDQPFYRPTSKLPPAPAFGAPAAGERRRVKFLPAAGAPAAQTQTNVADRPAACAACGAALRPGSVRCGNCGALVSRGRVRFL